MQVDAGMDKELVFGDPKAPRYVWWDKKLRPTPSGPDALTFDLLSIGGKLRAGLGALGIKQAAPGGSTILLAAHGFYMVLSIFKPSQLQGETL